MAKGPPLPRLVRARFTSELDELPGKSQKVANMPAGEKIGSGLRPKIGEKMPKNGFWLHREHRGKMAQK